jgi:uncharacterized protein (TIGR02453 family)
MPAPEPFVAFPEACPQFLVELARNNDREWFLANKARYEADVVAPARAFISAMGQRLRGFAPGVHADPRVNGTLFRLNRDVRFGHDKRPYKTHLGLWFWEGERERMECSGFYVHVEPPILMVAVGIHVFPKAHLETFRASVAHPQHGEALREAVEAVRAAGPYDVGGEHYKRIPPGYDADPDVAGFLKFNGLTAGIELPVGVAYTPGLLDVCEAHFRRLAPLHRWLLEMTRRVPG